MVYLNCCTIICPIDIERLKCSISCHILSEAYSNSYIDREYVKCIEISRYTNNTRSTRYIEFHIQHNCIRLDLQSSSIKRNPLTNKPKFLCLWSILGLQYYHIGLMDAPSSYCKEEITAEFFEFLFIKYMNLEVLPLLRENLFYNHIWSRVLWGEIDDITRPCNGLIEGGTSL